MVVDTEKERPAGQFGDRGLRLLLTLGLQNEATDAKRAMCRDFGSLMTTESGEHPSCSTSLLEFFCSCRRATRASKSVT